MLEIPEIDCVRQNLCSYEQKNWTDKEEEEEENTLQIRSSKRTKNELVFFGFDTNFYQISTIKKSKIDFWQF